LAITVVLFLITGTGLLLAAIYIKTSALWGTATGAVATSVAAFFFAGVFLWLMIRTSR
jgi:hypothetical protein